MLRHCPAPLELSLCWGTGTGMGGWPRAASVLSKGRSLSRAQPSQRWRYRLACPPSDLCRCSPEGKNDCVTISVSLSFPLCSFIDPNSPSRVLCIPFPTSLNNPLKKGSGNYLSMDIMGMETMDDNLKHYAFCHRAMEDGFLYINIWFKPQKLKI